MTEPVTVDVLVKRPVPEVFAYFADPRNRPQWQSSLRAIRMVDEGEPRQGMRWVDVTVVGLKPKMEITHFEPYRLWAERGTAWGIIADLTMRFTQVTSGTRVVATMTVAETRLRLPEAVIGRLAPAALKGDLERAAHLLTQRAAGQ